MATLYMGQDSKGEKFNRSVMVDLVAREVLAGTHLPRRLHMIKTEYEQATTDVQQAQKVFDASMDNIVAKQAAFGEAAKKASGNVRKAANELAEGLTKVEKTANFDKLERYVMLLERASQALTTLAALESDGKLDKIMQAVK